MNVLIIGLGSIADKHLAALKSFGTFRYSALRNTTLAASKSGIENCYSWEDIPDDVAFAIISNPTNMHSKTIADCIKRNIPLFIEKPVSHELAGLEELNAQIHRANVFTYVACNLRFLSSLAFLKNNIGCKRVNEVNVYCGSSLPAWRPATDFRLSYSADVARGGGVHLDLFHELDYVCWIFGMPKDSKGVVRNVSSLNISAPDFASYHLFYKHFTVSVTLNYYRPTAKREVEIVFDDAIWVLDLLQNRIVDDKGVVIFKDNDTNIKDTYLAQMRYFLDKLRSGEAVENTFSVSLAILKIALTYEQAD